jgi:hypothetical protein
LSGQSFLNSANSFKNLSFYESSFHFFLKRGKFYSTLNSQAIKIRPLLAYNKFESAQTLDNIKAIYPIISLLNAQSFLSLGLNLDKNIETIEKLNGKATSRDILLSRFDKIL